VGNVIQKTIKLKATRHHLEEGKGAKYTGSPKPKQFLSESNRL